MDASPSEFLDVAMPVGASVAFVVLYCLGFYRGKDGLTVCRWQDFGATRDAPPASLREAVNRIHARGSYALLALIYVGIIAFGPRYGELFVGALLSPDAYLERTIGYLMVGVITMAAMFATAWLAEYLAIRCCLRKIQLDRLI
jgi:hypothetical protein